MRINHTFVTIFLVIVIVVMVFLLININESKVEQERQLVVAKEEILKSEKRVSDEKRRLDQLDDHVEEHESKIDAIKKQLENCN